MQPLALRLVLGLALSLLIGILAYRRKSLSASGTGGAIIIGTIIFGFGGTVAGLLLVAFFITSSAVSHYKKTSLQKVSAARSFDKNSRRDLGQVLANGGFAAVFAVGHFLTIGISPTSSVILYAGLVGAIATANADTWATELGVLNHSGPRLITNLSRQVAPGVSGGVSLVGTLAAIAGSLVIGLLFGLLSLLDALGLTSLYIHTDWIGLAGAGIQTFIVVATMSGTIGALIDSWLGATIQASYLSADKSNLTERAFEADGSRNVLVRGWSMVHNDTVNALATFAGGIMGMASVAVSLLT